MRILVRAPNWIGDHVMALPFYAALRRQYPEAHLSLLHTAQTAGLNLGEFDETQELPRDWRRPRSLLAFARALRKREYAVAFSLPASWSSNALLWLSRIPCRIGFDEGGSGVLLTHALRWRGPRAGRHKSSLYAELLDLGVDAAAFQSTSAHLTSANEKKIVLAPGAALGLREWPYVEDLALKLAEKFPDHELVLVGGPGEQKWQTRLGRLGLANFTDRVGQTTLDALCSLLCTASVVIANDSGVAHLAATVADRPTVVLYGPGNPEYIRPLGGNSTSLFVSDLGCRPCDSNRCLGGYGYQACLRELSPDRVFRAVEAILTGAPAAR
ncbi:MAG: lipopolysaccharide heptosyltransferase II [Bdellovibrionaceae bacterium]|nr:lipopolysaccharide heptosyltransferase II [Bdellovibrionales bacterium]MCB9254933.1 lipopolysaccharide heptosyltransferase II [Pseudobdellovibrionaceae bacterium]